MVATVGLEAAGSTETETNEVLVKPREGGVGFHMTLARARAYSYTADAR